MYGNICEKEEESYENGGIIVTSHLSRKWHFALYALYFTHKTKHCLMVTFLPIYEW